MVLVELQQQTMVLVAGHGSMVDKGHGSRRRVGPLRLMAPGVHNL